jgi:hypothetical protein
MQYALLYKRKHMEQYIKFISHFGPALRGMAFWNSNKTTKLVRELLTVTNEAFIHLCIINYSATWKAQERKKAREADVQVPVSFFYGAFISDVISNKWLLTALSLTVD